jgi:hypothetical protein
MKVRFSFALVEIANEKYHFTPGFGSVYKITDSRPFTAIDFFPEFLILNMIFITLESKYFTTIECRHERQNLVYYDTLVENEDVDKYLNMYKTWTEIYNFGIAEKPLTRPRSEAGTTNTSKVGRRYDKRVNFHASI